MLHITWVVFPLYFHDIISLLENSVYCKDQEENLLLGEESPPSFSSVRDRATFGVAFLIELGMPKILIPVDLDKEAIACVRSCLNK